jgi:hypothetical protein
MWLFLCYILTRTLILAEVITLIKNDTVTCVLIDESVYSGLYISPLVHQKGKNIFTCATIFYIYSYRIKSNTNSTRQLGE